jgi:tetratricopeptide (TPR) repeat protein
MDEVYELLIHKVHDYEGTVNEMTGDGIMALFGAPIALEDAPQRAVRSAMAIHREMVRFSDRVRQKKRDLPPVKMRIGIHTGPVVVGTLGNNLRVEFKAVGDTVNLASRMEGLADPGTTYVTEDTFKLTERLFRFEALGKRQVKGKEQPIQVYRTLEASSRRTRFDVSAERGLTLLVGRERELDLLLDAFERAKEGRGQAMSIVSEAGIGKSRLLYEFRKAVANEDVTFLEGKCLSYSRNVAYHPVADILRSNFDIEEGDDDFNINEKVKKVLKALGADEASTLPYLLEVLSVKDIGIDEMTMSPEAKRHRIARALKHIVLKGSEIRPLILAFEDLHWIDRSSEDSLKDMLDSIAGSKVFLIFTYRPEYVGSWGGKSYHSQVNLNRLTNRETLDMVANLLGTEDIANDLEDLILKKTEGVPFFLEEFIKSLKDLNIITSTGGRYQLKEDVQALEIPSTIQDVIMARIDSLSEGAREVLQTGSVIEREFSYDLIKEVMGLPEKELMTSLSVLKDSELLFERGVYPQTTYIFKHALTREVVYDSILSDRKRKVHEIIGNAILRLHESRIDDFLEILAGHFIRSRNYEKAAEYSKRSRKKLIRKGSDPDAINYGEKLVDCLEKLPRTSEQEEKLISARTVLGMIYLQLNYHPEAKQSVAPIIDLAAKHNSKIRLCQINIITGSYKYFVHQDSPGGFEDLEKALDIAKKQNDIVLFATVNFWLGLMHSINTEFDKALECYNNTLRVSEAANIPWNISVNKSNISYFVHYLHGEVNKAFELSKEAVLIAEEIGDIYPSAHAYISYGSSCIGKGFLSEAEERLLKGIEFCEKAKHIAWNWIAQFYLGDIYFEMGRYDDSKKHFEKTIELVEQNRMFLSTIDVCRLGIMRAMIMKNGKNFNLEPLISSALKNKYRVYEGWIPKFIGDILLNTDDERLGDAEGWIKRAIEADKRNGMNFCLGKDYYLYASFWKKKENNLKARENLSKAIDVLKECGADGWVEKYEKELALL